MDTEDETNPTAPSLARGLLLATPVVDMTTATTPHLVAMGDQDDPSEAPSRPLEPRLLRAKAESGATGRVRLVTADWRARAAQVGWPTAEALARDWDDGLCDSRLRVPAGASRPAVGLVVQVILAPPDGPTIRTTGIVASATRTHVLLDVDLSPALLRRLNLLARSDRAAAVQA